jgi:hypothetical protein
MESTTKLLLEELKELTRMVREDIRQCFFEHVAGFTWDTTATTSPIDERFTESVCSLTFVPAPEV